MKRIYQISVICLVPLLLFFAYKSFKKSKIQSEENISLLTERIEEISTLMVIEGHFSEVYTFKEVENKFYGLLPFEKKIILLVKARAMIGYDLSKMEYEIDRKNKKVLIKSLPEQDIIIEPEITYYDIQESTFNKFNEADLTKINKKAVELIRKEVKNSYINDMAQKRLKETLQNIVFATETIGWDIGIEPFNKEGISLD